MTKKLEDILNLPNVKEAFKEVDKKEKDKKIKEANGQHVSSKNLDPQTQKNLQKSYAEFDKAAAALPQVKGLGELSDLELDKLAIEAEESYKKAITFKPELFEAYYNLGIVLKNNYKLEEAEKYYKKAINLKPNFADTYNNLGTVLDNLEKFFSFSLNF